MQHPAPKSLARAIRDGGINAFKMCNAGSNKLISDGASVNTYTRTADFVQRGNIYSSALVSTDDRQVLLVFSRFASPAVLKPSAHFLIPPRDLTQG
jgi:hypothetical protein